MNKKITERNPTSFPDAKALAVPNSLLDSLPIPNSASELEDWLNQKNIDEVECLIPDSAGVARGKIIPRNKFIAGMRNNTLKIPDGIFVQMITGDYIDDERLYSGEDRYMVPDHKTIRVVPWYENPTAQIICDVQTSDGEDATGSPRGVLRKVLEYYRKRHLHAVIAPELELYFVDINTDPDYPLEPPIGLSKRRQINRQAYGIDAANEFDPLVEDIYDYAERMRLDIDTFAHEMGAAQVEFNLNHGEPLLLADQVFLFKRMARQAALRHNIYATFMAKPHQHEAGSAMHIHVSVYDTRTDENVFSTKRGKLSRNLHHFIGGLQQHVDAAMAFYAPNVNSYRRITCSEHGLINSHWARDNRSVGFRVPVSLPENLRVENRLPGADCNPYLVIAATLACGIIGIRDRIEASPEVYKKASHLKPKLPHHIFDSIAKLAGNQDLKEILGEEFIRCYCQLKREEFDRYHKVISSWERENLLLNV